MDISGVNEVPMLGSGQNREDVPHDNPFHIARTTEEALARRELTGIYENRANRMEPFSAGAPTMYGPAGTTQSQLMPESQATIDGQQQQQYWQQNRDWQHQQMQPDPLIQPALTGQQLTGTSPQLPRTQLQLPSTQLLQPGTSPFDSRPAPAPAAASLSGMPILLAQETELRPHKGRRRSQHK